MATTTKSAERSWLADHDVLECPSCHSSLRESEESLTCEGCNTVYPIRDGVLIVQEQLASDNRIAADFYNSGLWPKFRFWERFFWLTVGGERRRASSY